MSKFLCYLDHHYFEFFSYMQPNLTDPSSLPHCQSIPLSSQQMEISVYQLLRPKALELVLLTCFLSYPTTIHHQLLLHNRPRPVCFSLLSLLSLWAHHYSWPLNNTGLRGPHPLCTESSASHFTVYFLCLWFHIHGFDQPLIMWYYSTDVLKTICMEEDSLSLLVFLLPLWQLLPPLISLSSIQP